MGTSDKMEIAEWQASSEPPVFQKRNRKRFWSPAIIGALGTLLLHSFIFESVQWAGRGIKVTRLIQDAGGDPAKTSAESSNSLVLIALPSKNAASETATVQNIVSSLPALSKISLSSAVIPDAPAPLNIESLTLGEDQASSDSGNGGDVSERARLTGIYSGQIQARIDRVWRRPRTPVNEEPSDKKTETADESFQCEAQIIQDNSGYVQEILLPRCNGSPAWQRSLVMAIRQASPLPAPPDPTVFARSITLRFIGLPYAPGASADEYTVEPPSVALAR
jgi:hypothetical protein